MTPILEGYLPEQVDMLSKTVRTLLNRQRNHLDTEMVTFVGQYVFSLERDAQAALRHNRYDDMSAIINELCDLVSDLSKRNSSALAVNKHPAPHTTNTLVAAAD